MSSRNRPTFEVGESSAKWDVGLEDSPNINSPDQALSKTQLRSTKSALESSSVPAIETRITCKKLPISFSSSDRQILGRKWFIQLRAGGRMEIMGLELSPWDFFRSNHGVGLGRWMSGMIAVRSTFPSVGVEDRGVWCDENQERSLMVVEDCSNALMLEPLVVDFSMAE